VERACNKAIALCCMALILAVGWVAAQSADEVAGWVNQGIALQDAGEYRKAEALFFKALDHGPRVWGKRSENMGSLLNNLALNFNYRGEYAKAEPLFEQALDLYEYVFGESHPRVAMALSNLALLYDNMGRYDKAEPLARRALKICERKLGTDHPQTADSLLRLAGLQKAKYGPQQVEPMYLRVLEIREARLGKDHPDVADVLNDLALLSEDLGRFGKAETYFLRALSIYESKLGKDHPRTATALQNLGLVCVAYGQHGRAEKLYRQALEIRTKRLGADHPLVGDVLNNLGNLAMELGKMDEAAVYHLNALRLREKKLSPDHPEIAQSLGNLAIVLNWLGKHDDAEQLYLRDLKITESVRGPEHPCVALVLNNLANHYADLQQYAKAQAHFERALKIYEKAFGPAHPDYALALANLASTYREQGQFDKSGELFARALAIKKARPGYTYIDIDSILFGLALVQESLGRTADTLQILDEQRRMARQFMAQVLPLLSPREQMSLLRKREERDMALALSLPLRHAKNQKVLAHSVEWLLNGKGLGLEAIAELSLSVRAGNSASPTRAELLGVRRELARMALTRPLPGLEKDYQDRLTLLGKRERELTQQLAADKQVTDTPWHTLAELRQSLTETSVFVQIARFMPRKLDGKPEEWKFQPARYVAWIVPKSGDVQLVDLDLADKIDGVIRSVRTHLDKASGVILAKGEPEAEKVLRTELKALSDLVLAPLRFHLDSATEWIISPDGQLWLVPWAALPLDDKTYAVEKHALRFVVSGRDLMSGPPPVQVSPKAPVLFADPDFDALLDAPVKGQAPLSGDFKLGKVQRLPGSAAEAEAIAEHLKPLAEAPARVLMGKQAVVAAFHKVRQPKYLVFSTHGFFLPDQESSLSDRDRVIRAVANDPKIANGTEDPWLRCGLLLAGCNHAHHARPGSDTGVLTGREILSADLRGTELVVLSACDTGVGDVRVGEGVAGLREAFLLAGARSVLASLWQVPDRDTSLLMIRFFAHLARNKTPSEALRLAQQEMLRIRQEQQGAAHPHFWAAFTVTGK